MKDHLVIKLCERHPDDDYILDWRAAICLARHQAHLGFALILWPWSPMQAMSCHSGRVRLASSPGRGVCVQLSTIEEKENGRSV